MKTILIILVLYFSVTSYAGTEEAITLLHKLESSAYGNRIVCTLGNEAFGIIPGSHWSRPSSFAIGTIDEFPQQIIVIPDNFNSPILIQRTQKKLITSINGVDFYEAPGSIQGLTADICVYESKVLAE